MPDTEQPPMMSFDEFFEQQRMKWTSLMPARPIGDASIERAWARDYANGNA